MTRRKHRVSCSWVMQVSNYSVMHTDTDLAGGRSKELLFLLQVLSFGCQGLLLCVLLTPQVAGQTQTATHCYTYVTRNTKTRLQPRYNMNRSQPVQKKKSLRFPKKTMGILIGSGHMQRSLVLVTPSNFSFPLSWRQRVHHQAKQQIWSKWPGQT